MSCSSRSIQFMRAIPDILKESKTIAVVGCSANPSRTSYAISRYLIEVGYTMIPVNPGYEEIHGQVCYPDMVSIPDDIHVDIVTIFRRPGYTAAMVEDVLKRIEKTGERPVIWTQIGVSSNKAQKLAESAGLEYIRNRCILVEHSHLSV